MPTSIFTLLDTRRVKKDGTYPIVFRIIHNEVATTVKTGYSVLKSEWNPSSLTVRPNCKHIADVSNFNLQQREKEKEMQSALLQSEREGTIEHLSIREIKKRIIQRSKHDSSFTTNTTLNHYCLLSYLGIFSVR